MAQKGANSRHNKETFNAFEFAEPRGSLINVEYWNIKELLHNSTHTFFLLNFILCLL
jgi:hypothetical protein